MTEIIIQTPDDKCWIVNVEADTLIYDIKKILWKKTGLEIIEQELMNCREILLDNSSINDYQIDHVIYLKVKLMDDITIFIRTMEDEVDVIYAIKNLDTILNVKRKIKDKIAINVSEQTLLYNLKLLQDDMTVNDCGIKHGDCITVIVRVKFTEIDITARTLDGRSWPFRVNVEISVMDLKMKVREATQIPFNSLILMYQGVILNDYLAIKDYGVNTNSVINIIMKILAKNMIKLFVKCLNLERVYPIDIYPDFTVTELKQAIGTKFGFKWPDLKLIFGGIVLEDDINVNEYEFVNGDNIFVILRNRDLN